MSFKNKKIVSLASLKKHVQRLRRARKTIVFTNGCFDILHYGHVNYLQEAKKGKGNRILIVGINSDASLRALKGPRRPIVKEEARAAILAALECVDFITIFPESTPWNLIKAVEPDVLVKGADWKGKEVVGSGIVLARRGKVEFIDYIKGYSTTEMIKAIVEKCTP